MTTTYFTLLFINSNVIICYLPLLIRNCYILLIGDLKISLQKFTTSLITYRAVLDTSRGRFSRTLRSSCSTRRQPHSMWKMRRRCRAHCQGSLRTRRSWLSPTVCERWQGQTRSLSSLTAVSQNRVHPRS